MVTEPFSIPVVRLAGQLTRRRSLALLGLFGLGSAVRTGETSAKKRSRKSMLCLDRQTIRVKKRQKRKLLRAGATPGACVCLSAAADLQAAIDAVAPGATLMLCAGVWNVTSTIVVDRDLTLVGVRTAKTILDGGNAVRVLQTTEGTSVTLQDLTITHGNAGEGSGGGIANERGTLTLLGVAVTANTAEYGGGLYNGIGTLTLGAGCRVSGNRADRGAGIGGMLATLTLQAGSSVTGNTATIEGGGIVSGRSDVTLTAGSDVSGNLPDNCFPDIGTCH